jgi:pyruvate formate lyase activating enzyme
MNTREKYFGLQKTSLIDFPGTVSCIVFTRGCNLRCPYCHNPELVGMKPFQGMVSEGEVRGYLEKRKNLLQGVCITGGEPLLHPEIGEWTGFARSLGLKVKLDTNGLFPEKLKNLELDYIAMDIKTLPEKYDRVGAVGGECAERIRESISWIIRSGVPHEFRTTVAPGIVDREDIPRIGALLAGADRYVLTQVRKDKLLDPGYARTEPYPIETLFGMKAVIEAMGIPCSVRMG